MFSVSEWKARGRTITVPDGRIWMTDTGAPADSAAKDAIPVLVLHGFPTASWDFADAIERVSKTRRVVAFDFLGFGFSDKPATAGYSLFEQTDIAIAVARAADLTRAHIWAHDMGTSVATEMCARRLRKLLPLEMESLILMNGSVHIELSQLTIGQKILRTKLGPYFAKLNSKTTFTRQIQRVFAKKRPRAELDAMWALVSREDGILRFPQIIDYTRERARYRSRWIGALEQLDVPALIAWGELDPVAVMPIARLLAKEIPGAELVTFADLGHYPQVEDPDRVAETAMDFWERVKLRPR